MASAASVAAQKSLLGLVKADVGLSAVENTADSAKPVSTAQQSALDLKADTTTVNSALAGKADDTATTDALARKADAAATTASLNTKANTTDVNNSLALKAPSVHTHSVSDLADATALARQLLQNSDISSMLSTLGFAAFAKNLVGVNSAAAFRSSIGAEADFSFTPVQQGTGVGQTPSAVVKIGWTSAGALPKMTIDSTDMGRIWTDWEGSRSFSQTAMYQKLPGGMIIQGGVVYSGVTDRTIAFPIAFPNYSVPIAISNNTAADSANWSTCYVSNFDRNGFIVRNRTAGGAAIAVANIWIAIGY